MALVEGILNKIFDRLWWRRASEQCGLSQWWSWWNLVKFDVPLLAIGKYLILVENIWYYWQMFGIIVKQLKIKHHLCGMCIITSIALRQKFSIAAQFSISASKWFCLHHIKSSFVIPRTVSFEFTVVSQTFKSPCDEVLHIVTEVMTRLPSCQNMNVSKMTTRLRAGSLTM